MWLNKNSQHLYGSVLLFGSGMLVVVWARIVEWLRAEYISTPQTFTELVINHLRTTGCFPSAQFVSFHLSNRGVNLQHRQVTSETSLFTTPTLNVLCCRKRFKSSNTFPRYWQTKLAFIFVYNVFSSSLPNITVQKAVVIKWCLILINPYSAEDTWRSSYKEHPVNAV
jgi:hypothetical protein